MPVQGKEQPQGLASSWAIPNGKSSQVSNLSWVAPTTKRGTGPSCLGPHFPRKPSNFQPTQQPTSTDQLANAQPPLRPHLWNAGNAQSAITSHNYPPYIMNMMNPCGMPAPWIAAPFQAKQQSFTTGPTLGHAFHQGQGVQQSVHMDNTVTVKPCPVCTGLFFGKTYRDNGNFSNFKSNADSPGRFPVSNFSRVQP